MSTLSWGSSGPEVQQLQQQLKDAGFFFGPLDGKYGPLTSAAVERFQNAHGLKADGIAGPATLAALKAPPGDLDPAGGQGGSAGTPQTLSLHIGLDRVNPADYGGWEGRLSGCVNDAKTMVAIASAEGFTHRTLFTEQATVSNILSEIGRAANALTAGGTFLLTYAGHGGQVDDPAGDEENDHKDETWVAFDRQLLDDELEQAFTAFKRGVSIVVMSDSCHSGSVYRYRGSPASTSDDSADGGATAPTSRSYDLRLQSEFAALKQTFYRSLALPRPGPTEPPLFAFPRPREDVDTTAHDTPVPRGAAAVVKAGAPRKQTMVDDRPMVTEIQRESPVFSPPPFNQERTTGRVGALATRNIPLDVNLQANETQRDRLAQAKTRSRSRGAVQASGILLAGCADNQLSQEVNGAGVFTTTLNRVWANNSFAGTYSDLIQQIVSQMGPSQTPQLSTFGQDVGQLVARTPFNTR
jgi:peptidoglycan hydrolase-like protein with peptidoglycan-binding domain